MIVYAQPQKLELKRNGNYRALQSVILFIFRNFLEKCFSNDTNNLSIFTKNLDIRTQHSCFTKNNSVIALYAVVVALLQRSKK
jgi:hypothetical protein